MRRRKSAEERRDEIVAATLRLASEESPEQVTTEAIARAVGITQAAVFRHFSSKSGIWVAVAAWLAETAPCRWREAAAGPASPPDRLRAVVRTQLAFMAAVPAVPAILLARGLQSDAAVRRALLGVMGEFGRTLASLLAEGRRSGHFRADLEAERAAQMLVALAQGTAIRWLLSDRAFDLVADGMAGVDLALAGSQVETPNRLQA